MDKNKLRQPVRIDKSPRPRKAERSDGSPDAIRENTSRQSSLTVASELTELLDAMADHPDYANLSPDRAIKLAQDMLSGLPDGFNKMSRQERRAFLDQLL